MAGRRAVKANPRSGAAQEGTRRRKTKPPPCGATPAHAGPSAGSALAERIAALERERDELKAALDEERARRRKLEEVYAAARDRISRALDSLHTILNAKS